MPLPFVLYNSIGVLFTSEGAEKSSLPTEEEDELRGVFGRDAAELVSAASPGVALALRPDIVIRRGSSFGSRTSTSVHKSDTTRTSSLVRSLARLLLV